MLYVICLPIGAIHSAVVVSHAIRRCFKFTAVTLRPLSALVRFIKPYLSTGPHVGQTAVSSFDTDAATERAINFGAKSKYSEHFQNDAKAA